MEATDAYSDGTADGVGAGGAGTEADGNASRLDVVGVDAADGPLHAAISKQTPATETQAMLARRERGSGRGTKPCSHADRAQPGNGLPSGSMSGNATAIAIFEVDDADRDRVLTWQSELDTAAAKRHGFVRSHFTRGFDDYDDWAAAVTFTSESHLRHWLDSSERAELLAQGHAFGARTRDTIILLPGERPPAGVGVFLHSVSPEDHVGFLQIEASLNREARSFPGYLGGLVLAPSDPSGTWISVVRFDDEANLNSWLTSPERAAQLRILRKFLVQDFEQITRRTPFGSIIRVVDGQTRQTPNWKTAMVVLLVLYPTVMLLTRFLGPVLNDWNVAPGMGLWISNIASVILLTFLFMPMATRIFRLWLDPIDGAPLKVTLIGAGIILALYAVELLVFQITFLQYWHY